MTASRILSPLKGPGAKHYLAPWVASHFPPRDRYLTFVDAMCRTGAVLLAHDPAGKAEVANDLDGRITNFWRCLQTEESFARLQRLLAVTPFSEAEFAAAADRLAGEGDETYVGWPSARCAADFFILARQSMAGREKHFAPLTKARLRRGMSEQVSAWLSAVEGLPPVRDRMSRVLVRNLDVFELIKQLAHPQTFFYLDPPYHPETLAVLGVYGKYGWDEPDSDEPDKKSKHQRLLELVKSTPGLFCISGYDSALYRKELASWNRHEKPQVIHSSSGKTKRRAVEVVWKNY